MGVRRIYRRSTPYQAAEMPAVGWEQAVDLKYLAHTAHPPHKLVRYGDTSWLLEAVDFGTDMATPTGVAVDAVRNSSPSGWDPIFHYYSVTAFNELTGQESLVSVVVESDQENDLAYPDNYNEVTWSAVADATYYNVYKFVNGNYGFIGTSDDLVFQDQNIAPDYSITPPRARNPFDSENNYPGTVTFFEQRSIWARTLTAPSAVWGSRSSDFENMNVSRPLQANDAWSYKLVSRGRNIIQHLVPMKVLLATTDTSLFSLSGPEGFISPTAVTINSEGARGANKVRPVLLEEGLCMYFSAKGSFARTVGYEFQTDGYKGNDITVFAKHLFEGHFIVQAAWAEYPNAVLWCVRDDGKLLCLTWQAEQDVWGWSLCETDGVVESCCVVPEGGVDTLYIAVARQVGGQTRRYIERLATPLWTDIDEACYLDSAVRYSGPPTDEISGLEHLEGREVMALCDGDVRGPFTVTDGSIPPFPVEYSNIVVGLAYESWFWTLPQVNQVQGIGSTHTRTQDAAGVSLTVLDTRGIEVGQGRRFRVRPPEIASEACSKFVEVQMRGPGADLQLYSGEFWTGLPPSDWKGKATVVVRQRYPLPMTVLGVTIEGQMGG